MLEGFGECYLTRPQLYVEVLRLHDLLANAKAAFAQFPAYMHHLTRCYFHQPIELREGQHLGCTCGLGQLYAETIDHPVYRGHAKNSIERMRPVVEAAIKYREWYGPKNDDSGLYIPDQLCAAVDEYLKGNPHAG